VVPSFSIRGIEANVGIRHVSVDLIQSCGTEVRGWINQDGTVNFQSLFASQEESAIPDDAESSPPQGTESEESPWSATIKKISLEEYVIRFEDRQPSTPIPFLIENFGLQVQNVTTDMSKPIALELVCTFNQSAQLAVSGHVTPEPLAVDLKMDISDLAFASFQPYLDPFVQFQLERGVLSVKGHTTFQAEVEKDSTVRFSGDMIIDDFALVDAAASEEFLKWEQLAFQGMVVDSQTVRMDLREIVVTLPYATVVHSEDGILNVSRLFSPARVPAE